MAWNMLKCKGNPKIDMKILKNNVYYAHTWPEGPEQAFLCFLCFFGLSVVIVGPNLDRLSLSWHGIGK
jgi:hypothetical protein